MKTYITYNFLLWAIVTFTISVSILDRMLIPITKGDIVLGRTSRNGIRTEDMTVFLIELFWMISARLLLACLNVTFYTMMYAFPNMLTEIAPKWIDMNTRETHFAMHKFVGIWFTGVPAVIHVVLLFVPLITSGYSATLVYRGWNFHEWYDPCIRGFDYYLGKAQGILYTYDEIYRLVLTVFAFCVALPVSRADWMLKKSYSWAMFLHIVFGGLYAYDLIRKKSHPLSWYFNIPVVAAYLIDRIISTFWYRTHKFELYSIKLLGKNHVVVYGKVPSLGVQNIATADTYFILHDLFNPVSISKFQRAHPFTAFQNHNPNTFHLWNIGFVMGVFVDGFTMDVALENIDIGFKRDQNQKSIFILKGDSTEKRPLKNNFEIKPGKSLLPVLRTWGPYRSAFYGLDSIPERPIVLVAGGAGMAIILSALQILKHKHNDQYEFEELFKYVHIYYTTRDIEMIDFLLDSIDDMLGKNPTEIFLFNTGNALTDIPIAKTTTKNAKVQDNKQSEKKDNLNVKKSSTTEKGTKKQTVAEKSSQENKKPIGNNKRNQVGPEPPVEPKGVSYRSATLYDSRPNFDNLFAQYKGTKGYCYFCGSARLSKAVGRAAKSARLEFKEESI